MADALQSLIKVSYSIPAFASFGNTKTTGAANAGGFLLHYCFAGSIVTCSVKAVESGTQSGGKKNGLTGR
jgi:hypothetical protein